MAWGLGRQWRRGAGRAAEVVPGSLCTAFVEPAQACLLCGSGTQKPTGGRCVGEGCCKGENKNHKGE